ncbi:MAG: cell division protein FtsB [Nevskiaceae bacterium]|jgi:cell division protein FtsB|nr:cell division protein FtsB [Nevskiaceae bacterium]
MKWLIVALLAVFLAIQYRLWVSPDGVSEVVRLREAVAAQSDENARLKQRNEQLGAEVRDLKQGFTALEERARSDLGLISRNETYYQVAPKSEAQPETIITPPAEPPARTAAR